MEELDKIVALIGLVLALFLTLWIQTMIHHYIEVGITLFLASLFYLVVRKRVLSSNIVFFSELKTRKLTYLILNLSFLTLLLYSSFLVISRPEVYNRPWEYFVSISSMCGLIVTEVMCLPRRKAYTYFVWVKIVLVALSLRWTPQTIFSTLLGSDVWTHSVLTMNILDMGRIPEGHGYSRLPIMHLLTDLTSLLTGLDFKFSLVLSISLSHIISLIYVFELGKMIHSPRIGLLASLLLGVSDYYLNLGVLIHPTSLAITLIPSTICMVFKAKKESSITTISLAILVMGTLILTHTVTSFCLTLLLVLFFVGSLTYTKIYPSKTSDVNRSIITWIFPTFYTIAMFSWWMFASGHIVDLAKAIEWGFKFEYWETPQLAVQYMYEGIPFFEYLLNHIAFFLFYAFSVIGSLYMLSKKIRDKYSFVIILGGWVLVTIPLVSVPLDLLGTLPERWLMYSQLILVIPSVIGFLVVCSSLKRNQLKALTLIMLISVVTFFMITNPIANMDNPIYSKNSMVRFAYTDSEFQAANTILQLYDGELGTDRHYTSYLYQHRKMSTARMDVTVKLVKGSYDDLVDRLIIIRKEIAIRPFYAPGTLRIYHDPRVELSSNGFNRIYDSETVTAFSHPLLPLRKG